MMVFLGNLLLLVGGLFCLLGALGLVRMPDVYNRIQAGTKAVTMGSLCILAGVGFLYPAWWPKLVAVALFVVHVSHTESPRWGPRWRRDGPGSATPRSR